MIEWSCTFMELAAWSSGPNEIAMPTIYRAMKRADDGLPAVGSNSKELGVRVPPNPNAEIDLDENGNVIRFFHNPDYMEYVRLLFDLHAALAEGRDETDEGEALRERMDQSGSRLLSDEIASLSGIAADFYSLADEPPTEVSPMTADVLTDLEPILKPRKSKAHGDLSGDACGILSNPESAMAADPAPAASWL